MIPDNSHCGKGAMTGRALARDRPLIDAPAVLFACDLRHMPLTERSMTLCGQRDSVTTQVVPMRWRLPAG
jgi:hypothetical protein